MPTPNSLRDDAEEAARAAPSDVYLARRDQIFSGRMSRKPREEAPFPSAVYALNFLIMACYADTQQHQ